jgi:hypothetical protein
MQKRGRRRRAGAIVRSGATRVRRRAGTDERREEGGTRRLQRDGHPWSSRRALWAGFAAAIVALLALLLLQYRWLAELERSQSLARRAILVKLLDVVDREAFSELKTAAEPPSGSRRPTSRTRA